MLALLFVIADLTVATPVSEAETLSGLHSVWASDGGDVYAVGSGGVILHSGDRGFHWQRQASGTRDGLWAVWGSGPDEVYAVGNEGTVLHTRDRGRTWERPPTGTTEWLSDVWGSDGGNVYFVEQSRNNLLHTVDHGRHFREERVPAEIVQGAFSVWGHDRSVMVEGLRADREGGRDGIVDRRHAELDRVTRGKSWGEIENHMWLIHTASGVLYQRATYRLIGRSTDGGATWSYLPTGGEVSALWATDDGDVYAIDGGTTIWHSNDRGDSFARFGRPAR